MLFQTLLAGAAAAAALPAVLAVSCPKPVVVMPSGVISADRPLTITGTTTWPCWEVDIYVNDQFHTTTSGEGAQENGSNLTISWEDDLLLPQGSLSIQFRASDPFDASREPTYSDAVTVSYGHSGCPEPMLQNYWSRWNENTNDLEFYVWGYAAPYYEGGCGSVRAYIDGVEWQYFDLDEKPEGQWIKWTIILKNMLSLGHGSHEMVFTKEEYTGRESPSQRYGFYMGDPNK